ncbi:hypothetical protein [Halobaculum limi]|uniref:hypothetical protein n=1 Tax=Halobaculum limi TaxID=3031916 RepID=UPI002405DFAF|nr:hypothetical protein [Halobaculum sp. YSMS11]
MTIDGPSLARTLRVNGIDVEEVYVDPDRVQVAYTTTLPGMEPDHAEMGKVCNTFIDLAEDDEFDPRRVDAVSLRFETDVQAAWHIEEAWITDLLAYRISEEEFSERVLDSIETDPDPDVAVVPEEER